jgi:hypothetical protein
MPFKKHISLFLVFFISFTTSIRDQHGHQVAQTRLSVSKPAAAPPLLAQVKAPK